MGLRESWSKIWPLAVILVITIAGWFLLSELSLQTHSQGQPMAAVGKTADDYKNAKVWATDLLGIAAALAGFLGISTASRPSNLDEADRAQAAESGLLGVLAGATLLGVGGWPIPIALAALATGVATSRIVQAMRRR